MPTYEYLLLNKRTGRREGNVCLTLPIEDRDNIQLSRVSVPSSLLVKDGGSVRSKEDKAQCDSVLKAYHKWECKHGSRAKFDYSASTIKKAWTPIQT